MPEQHRQRRRGFLRRSKVKLAAVIATAGMLASGCGTFTGIYDLPLPGGADIGSDPIELKVQFRDVLDLVPQTHVKINEVAVGRVQDVDLATDAWYAEVTILVNRDVDMPANALANIKQSSLLGEKYIELVSPPRQEADGDLADAEVIPLSRTNRNVEVEEVLGALSMLLNGGGVEQLNTITKELNKVADGAGGTQELKSVLRNSEKLVRSLDGQTDNISKALDGLNKLGKTLRKEKDTISDAVDDLPQGMKVLDKQRKDIVRMLKSLQDLRGVATDTMNKSKEDLVENLNSLRPTLQKITEAGADLPNALELMVSFPFSDAAVDGVHGDYFNLFMRIDADVQDILDNLRSSRDHPAPDSPLGDLPMAEGELLDPNQVPDAEIPELPLNLPELPPLGLPDVPSGSTESSADTSSEDAESGAEDAQTRSGATDLLDTLTGSGR